MYLSPQNPIVSYISKFPPLRKWRIMVIFIFIVLWCYWRRWWFIEVLLVWIILCWGCWGLILLPLWRSWAEAMVENSRIGFSWWIDRRDGFTLLFILGMVWREGFIGWCAGNVRIDGRSIRLLICRPCIKDSPLRWFNRVMCYFRKIIRAIIFFH